jgi:hypothetical protein
MAAQRQRWTAANRAGGTCEFEVLTPQGWKRCPHRGQEAAHAPYPRRECGRAWEDPDVVLWACRPCHIAHADPALAKGRKVRVPVDREAAAWAVIMAVSKVLTTVRKRPRD